MTDRELMQQALDALEGYARNCRCEGGGAPCDAAEALHARLAGWERVNMNDHKEGNLGIGNPNQVTLDTSGATTFSNTPIDWDASAQLVVTPHPAFKKPWVGLTDEEVRDLWSWSMTAEAERTANTQQHAFARAIEAKLKEKNT